MSDEAMRALIERVEQAQGADRELDALLWCALKGYRLTAHAYGKWTYYVPGAACEGRTADIPAYTGSLDAAVSLVPSARSPEVSCWSAEEWSAPRVHAAHVRATAWVPGAPRCYAATPALALVAAALRARLAMSDTDKTTRDEPRIRHNLDRYHEAAERWRIYTHRARQARATMDDALACLRAAGGTKEAERLNDG